jgi:hypothetical protein
MIITFNPKLMPHSNDLQSATIHTARAKKENLFQLQNLVIYNWLPVSIVH